MTTSGTLLAQQRDSVRVRISGTVVDSVTDQPVSNVQVRLDGAGTVARTDASGRYVAIVTAQSEFRATFIAVGYAPVTLRITPNDRDVRLDVSLAPQRPELENLEVTADLAADALRRQASSVRLDADAVHQQRGQTLGETLRETPGVGVIQFGPGIAKPVVRGLHSHRVVTMNGGVRQEGQQWGAEHAPEVDIFEAHEIEVVRGSGSVLYGSDALGGVVIIEPRPLTHSPGVGGEAAVNTFSNNLQAAGTVLLEAGSVSLPGLGATALRMRTSFRKAGDARTPDHVLRNSGFRETNVALGLGIDRSWGTSEIRASRFDTDLGLYVGAHVGNFEDLQRAIDRGPLDREFSYDIGAPRQEVTHDLLQWNTTLLTPSFGTVEANLAYQYNHRREYDNHGPVASRGVPAFALRLYTYSAGVRVRHQPIGPVHGVVGAHYLHQANVSSGDSFLIPQYWLNTGGIFAHETIDLGRLSLSAGARYDFRWQRVFEFDVGARSFPGETRTYDGASTSVGWSYLLADTWSVGGTVGQAWRAPNVNERFSLGVHHGTAQYEIGDETLGTERSVNTDVTVRHSGFRAALEVSAYRNVINDYIFLRPRPPVLTIRGAFPAFEYQQTDAVLYGVDAASEVWLTDALTVKLGGSVVRGTNRAISEPLYDLPADRLNASLRLTGAEGSRLSRPYVEVGGTFVREQDQVPTETVYALPTAGYTLFDLEVGIERLQLGSMPVEVSVGVRNLLNSTYRDYLSRYKLFIDDPGRDIVLRLRTPFGAAANGN